jgi:ribosome-associated protein
MDTDSKTKSFLIAEQARERKALDPVLLEMRGITSFTDYFFICSGASDRQVRAIADGIQEGLEREGLHPLGIEGAVEGRWILMDYGDVIVHIFLAPVREFYDLEGLWTDAPRINIQHDTTMGEGRIGPEKGTREIG